MTTLLFPGRHLLNTVYQEQYIRQLVNGIVENRWVGKVKLYRMDDGRLVEMNYPVTNIVLVGER